MSTDGSPAHTQTVCGVCWANRDVVMRYGVILCGVMRCGVLMCGAEVPDLIGWPHEVSRRGRGVGRQEEAPGPIQALPGGCIAGRGRGGWAARHGRGVVLMVEQRHVALQAVPLEHLLVLPRVRTHAREAVLQPDGHFGEEVDGAQQQQHGHAGATAEAAHEAEGEDEEGRPGGNARLVARGQQQQAQLGHRLID